MPSSSSSAGTARAAVGGSAQSLASSATLLDMWEVPFQELRMQAVIGRGSYGKVRWVGGRPKAQPWRWRSSMAAQWLHKRGDWQARACQWRRVGSEPRSAAPLLQVYRARLHESDVAVKILLQPGDGEGEQPASLSSPAMASVLKVRGDPVAWDSANRRSACSAREGCKAGHPPCSKKQSRLPAACLQEAAISASIAHPNVVKLIGVCLEPPSLVMGAHAACHHCTAPETQGQQQR